MADNVYKGGIPSQGFTGTFPSSEGMGDMYKPNSGPAAMTASHGGPATFSGSSSTGDFVDTAAYSGPGDMDPGAMKVRDLDDIKNSV